MFWRDTICLMGIPVDRVTAGEALGRIFALMHAYREDRRPRLATSLTAGFVVNALSGWSRVPRNPELLRVLREADLVTAGGRPLTWLCRRLGAPLAGHVSGPHLVLSLAREANRRGKSVYLLGATPEVAKRAADVLRMLFIDLKVAGEDSAGGRTDGMPGVNAERREAEICRRINESGADILLLGLGNPEQEMWFHRNRGRLQVPVTVGVDSSFAFVGGGLLPAPAWMQRCGLEWLYWLAHGPVGLWRRYVRDAGNFILLALPVIWASGKLRRKLQPHGITSPQSLTTGLCRLEGAAGRRLALLELPKSLVNETVEASGPGIVEHAFGAHALVVDASALCFADAAGIGFLMALQRECAARGQGFCLSGHSHARGLMQMNRVWDLFAPHACASGGDAALRLEERWGGPFCCLGIATAGGVRRVWLFGRLTGGAAHVLNRLAEQLLETPSDCILDLDGCAEADSSGLVELVKIANILSAGGKTLLLVRVPDPVRNLMKAVGLDDILAAHPDYASARMALDPG